MTSNKSDLNYWVFDNEYPLHSNSAILIAGGAGSGKSFFTYRILLPIYISQMGVKTILIASRTGSFDYTTRTELEREIYKNTKVEFIKIEDSYKKCQEIRASDIINEYLELLMKISDESDLLKISDKYDQLLKSTNDFTYLNDELIKFRTIFNSLLLCSIKEVRDYAEMLFIRGNKLTYNPIVIVFDDYAGTKEFTNPSSDIHKLIYCRRHLHLNMLLLTQSIIAVSTNIRRNISIFICFSTLSDKDLQLLSSRLPIKWNIKRLREAFYKIADAENRNDKLLTLFTVFPNAKIVEGSPSCLDKYYSLDQK